MTYILVTAAGRPMVFHVKACAELYQQINGGVVFTKAV